MTPTTDLLDAGPRFGMHRPDYPVQAGWCRYCLRQMFTGSRPGLRVLSPCSRWPGACDTCGTWLDDHPDGDPRDARNTTAERPLPERPEDDPSWRRDPARHCAGADPLPFEPDPDEDDDPAGQPSPEWLAQAREQAARSLCGPCPVRETCAAKALAHGYEGLWGGVLYGPVAWVSLLNGERGWTVHATERAKRAHARRLRGAA